MLEPFTLLFDDAAKDDEAERGAALPDTLRALYGGDWRLPKPDGRPYTYANFALSRDGRVSFNEPGHLGGGDVSGFNAHDRWLMGLLRARADAVVVGDNTLRLEPDHLWTCEYIFPDTEVFTALREAEGRKSQPLQVFLSLTGDLDTGAAVFCQPHLNVIVATTSRGLEKAQALRCAANVTALDLGEARVDLDRFVRVLRSDFGVSTLLCEGGPRVYGGFVGAGLIDDEFLTLCPTVIGNPVAGGGVTPRPGLVEGTAFMPDTYPKSVPTSLRRAGDHLFLKSRYVYP